MMNAGSQESQVAAAAAKSKANKKEKAPNKQTIAAATLGDSRLNDKKSKSKGKQDSGKNPEPVATDLYLPARVGNDPFTELVGDPA